MNKYRFLTLLLIVLGSNSALADEMDIDQADSLRFQDFHTDKKAAVKAWEKTEPTKAYQDQPATNGAATAAPAATAIASQPVSAANASTDAAGATGKRFEIRERYTLTRSTKTPYSAFYVIEPLFKQSAQLCPKGWKKLTERSEPVEQDFYLYYEIECL